MTIAVYAGSFDPITIGHLAVIGEASRIFGHVVVLIANNPAKSYVLTDQERLEVVKTSVKSMVNVSVSFTEGLVIDYAKSIGANILVRGVRDEVDSKFEMQLAQSNKALMPNLVTVLLPSNAALTDVSSSKIKEMISRGERIDGYCPPAVVSLLKKKLNKTNA